MSTKIYDAYRVKKPNASLGYLMEMAQGMREKITEKAKDRLSSAIALHVQYIEDLYTYYGESILNSRRKKFSDKDLQKELKIVADENRPNDSLWFDAYDILKKEFEEDGFHEFEASILFLPLRSRTLVMAFGDPAFFDDIVEDERLEDYHYQNQTDKPEDISTRVWNKRRKDWDEVLGRDYIPANHGFSFRLLSLDDPKIEMDICFGKEHRAKYRKEAKTKYKDRVKHILNMIECPLMKDCKLPSEFIERMTTDEYKEWEKKEAKRICKKLGIPESKIK